MVLPGGQLLAALAGAILATELQKRRRNKLKAGMQKTIDDLMAKLAAEHEELEDVRGTSNMLTLVRAALESKVHQLEAELDMAVFEASELMEDCGRLQTRYISKVEAMLRVLGQSTIEKATFQQIQALLISDEWTVVQDPTFDAVDGKENNFLVISKDGNEKVKNVLTSPNKMKRLASSAESTQRLALGDKTQAVNNSAKKAAHKPAAQANKSAKRTFKFGSLWGKAEAKPVPAN